MERKEPFDFAKTLFSSMCEIPPAVTGGELLEERMFPGITGPGLNSGNSARALGVKFKCGLASSWLPARAGSFHVIRDRLASVLMASVRVLAGRRSVTRPRLLPELRAACCAISASCVKQSTSDYSV